MEELPVLCKLIVMMGTLIYDFIEKPFKRADVEKVVFRVLEMVVRSNDLPQMIFLYGAHSKEVEQQKKFIGLLHAISAIGSKEIA